MPEFRIAIFNDVDDDPRFAIISAGTGEEAQALAEKIEIEEGEAVGSFFDVTEQQAKIRAANRKAQDDRREQVRRRARKKAAKAARKRNRR